MDNLKYNNVKVNDNIIFSKLREDKKYILIKTKNKYFPMFLKQKYIDILCKIKNNEYSIEKLNKLYGEEEIKILIDSNFIVFENQENEQVVVEYDKYESLNKLNKLAVITRTPIIAKIEITYNCNYKCDYCYVEDLKSSFLEYEDLKKIIYKLKMSGTYDLYITGGEAFLHPNIYEIIDYCDKLGIILTVQTNGSFINDNVAKKLSKYKHLQLAISFHSSCEKKFDQFTKIDGSFNKMIKAVESFKKYDLNYYLKHTVTKNNEDDLKNNVKFLEDNNIPFQIYCQILPDIADLRDTSNYYASEETLKWMYENKYLLYSKGACSALKNKCWISPEGNLYPCELYREKVGNLITDDFETIWNGENADKILSSNIYSEPDKCKICNNKEYCRRCLAYLNYKSWKIGINHFCETAQVVKNVQCKNI